MKKISKILLVSVFAVIVVAVGFAYTVKEGSCSIVTRFGKVTSVHCDAGLHFKLPWPIDKVNTYDTRSQYMDSGYTETLTNDKINIVMQTYAVWKIEDPKKFFTSVGNFDSAQNHLQDLITNTKNGIMGNYKLCSLVSTNLDDIKINEISQSIQNQVSDSALSNYGIKVEKLKIKRLALPENNIKSVFQQMIADRQKNSAQYIAEGERDSAKITSEANAKASEIIADGQVEASKINAETEKKIAEIYGEAYDKNSELFIFLKKLIALENSVNPDTIIIMKSNESPFDVITDK